MNPYRSQYKDRSPFSSTAASALRLPSLSNINSKIKYNPFDFNKFYQTGLLEDYKNRISIHDSHWKEYATRLQSIAGRKQAKEQADRMAEQGKANQRQGWLSAGASVFKAAAPLALAAITGGASIPFTAGLSAASGAASMFNKNA